MSNSERVAWERVAAILTGTARRIAKEGRELDPRQKEQLALALRKLETR